VLEAMACGLPIVASHVSGNDVLVADRKTGLLFDLDKPGRLADALSNLIRDRAAAKRMGAEGRTRIVERFSWQAVATEYLRLLDEPAGRAR